MDGGGPGQFKQMEEGQVTWCGWRRAGHFVWMEEGRSLCEDGGLGHFCADGGGPGHLVQM